MGRPTKAAAAAGLALALLVGVTALQVLRAALLTLDAAPTLEALRRGEPQPAARVADARRASQAAAGLAEAGRYLTDAALADMMLGREAAGVASGTQAAAALRVHPASPFNWLRLCLARLDRGDMDGARAAWMMSVDTGRTADRLLAMRIDAGFRVLRPDDAALVEALAGQVRLLAGTDRAALDAIATRRRAEPFVRAVLRSYT